MTAYYNEIDPYAAQWLRNLIAAGHIAPGDVDERSITEVQPDDLEDYDQCHFFAGIGGWSLALRLAGWPDDRPVWTGSCPCQPFSSAGSQRGSNDERHLWPAFFGLLRKQRPGAVFGEQVAGAAGLAWWDHVSADLEEAGYAAAAANIGAHSVGAPHIRQRLYWLADAAQRGQPCGTRLRNSTAQSQSRDELADNCNNDWPCPPDSHWRDADWLFCRDGKWRPVEPGTFPLANGVSARVGRLRAYGNAIVPQVAAQFIGAYSAALRETT